jgi:asparagine synthase (glutamine-hydrolysing)
VPSEPFGDGCEGGVHGLSVSQLNATSLPMQLHWNDRNSMAHSVESRAPFLDVRLVEFTLGLPDSLKLADGTTKVVLRRALADVLPEKISGRKDKMGFVTPEQIWVTRDRPERFRSLAHAAIDAAGNLFTPAARHRVDDIVGGRRRYHSSLWRIISFGAWVDRFNVAVN